MIRKILITIFFAFLILIIARSYSGKFVFAPILTSEIFGLLGISVIIYLVINAIGKFVSGKKREEKRINVEKVENRILEGINDIDPRYLEDIILFRLAGFGSYLKMRGESVGKITKEGYYERYVIWGEVVKEIASKTLEILKKYRCESKLLSYLASANPYELSNLLEDFAKAYETAKKMGYTYLPRKIRNKLEEDLKS